MCLSLAIALALPSLGFAQAEDLDIAAPMDTVTEPTATRNQEPAAPRNQEPAAPRNQEPAAPRNQEPAAPLAAPSSSAELAPMPESAPTKPSAAAPKSNASAATRSKKSIFSLKSSRNKEYDKAVFYDSMENLLPNMDLEYDLSSDQGKSLKIGDVVISPQSFFIALLPIAKFHSRMTSVVGEEEARKTALVLRWPQPLWSEGTLEVISRTGAVLWKQEISESTKNDWTQNLSDWQKGLEGAGVKSKFSSTSVFGTNFGIIDPESKGFKPGDESFRFCLSQVKGRSRSSLCSQRYVLRRDKGLSLSKVKMSVTPRVLLAGESAPLAQTIPVSKTAPTSLYAELANGESYEFVSLPNKLNLMDISSGKTDDQIRVVGFGTRPTVPSVILNPDRYSNITRAIGFESTIGDMRKFWEISISTVDPKIYLPGVAGGIFVQRLDVSEVPRANARPYLHNLTPQGTYVDGVKLFGRRLPAAKISSVENGIELDDEDPTKFTWFFKATERGKMNRSYLNLEYEGQQYKAFYEVYKGFPNEISGRLSGLVSPTGTSVVLSEVAYNHWFEDIFGWTQYTLSRQRWGVSAKYFKSLTTLKVGTGTTTTEADLTVTNVDLKYRLTPGLWNRDESLGAMLDYQSFQFAKVDAPMVGLGAFWARSMPKVFDDMFNIVPMMRYPKWVDMEFIYYPVSLTSTTTLKANFALNFHGKVMWSKHWFGEAGFGIKRYAVSDAKLNQEAALNTFYGTFGLGLSF